MTNSESEQPVQDQPEKTEMQKVVERTQAGDPGEVLGVLTGQVPIAGVFMGRRQELDGEMLDDETEEPGSN